MKTRSIRLFAILASMVVMTLAGTPAYAQGGGVTSAISGTVADASGAVIPGADVKLKNDATGAEFTTVTRENGTFSIPALQPGTYTVTVALMGFKTAVAKGVVVNAGVPVRAGRAGSRWTRGDRCRQRRQRSSRRRPRRSR
jgi:hypothetical protein